MLCPRQTPKLSRLTASPQVLITAGTRIITRVSSVFHVCCTSLSRVPPVVVRGLKFWAVQNFLPRPTPFRFFSASCHVYKSTVARLKLDINANNIVCFTGDQLLTGFGRDQAVKRCVTGPLGDMLSAEVRIQYKMQWGILSNAGHSWTCYMRLLVDILTLKQLSNHFFKL